MAKKVKITDLETMPAGNRTIRPAKVRDLKYSMSKYGITGTVLFIHTDLFGEGKKRYIVDGQHRIMAAIALGREDELPPEEVKHNFKSIEELVEFISVINAAQSSWILLDYVMAYASTNQFIDYNKLVEKKIKYGMSYNLTAIIYSGYPKDVAAAKIREGKFEVVNEHRADQISEILQDIVLLFNRSNSASLIRFSYVFYEWFGKTHYDHSSFKKYIEENIEKIKASNDAGILQILNRY